MPCCAVKWCPNHSRTSNLKSDNITFHQFPIIPNIRQKWIKATRRPDQWKPSKYTCMCSKHFSPDCFTFTKSNRRKLDPEAVPTLYLPIFNTDILDEKEEKEKPESPPQTEEPPETEKTPPAETVTPREKKLFYLLKEKIKEIKRLQYHNRTLKKKVKSLSEIVLQIKDAKLSKEEIQKLSLRHDEIMKDDLMNRHAVFLEVD